ncbi:MAG: NAD-glutamate dehydrogenase [Pseudomonadota bacterium]|nr:NAD-glutamate dehydrogenase [Pseudomonadota bacterium]
MTSVPSTPNTPANKQLLSPIERDYEKAISKLEASIQSAKIENADSLLEFAKAIFAHNPTADWLGLESHSLILSLQRFKDFVSSFSEQHKSYVIPVFNGESVDTGSLETNPFTQVMQKSQVEASEIAEIEPETEIMVLSQDMPFIVDSLRILMNQEQLNVIRQLYSVVITTRENGRLISVKSTSKLEENQLEPNQALEAAMYLQVKESLDESQRAAVEEKVNKILKEVRATNNDFGHMLDKCHNLAAQYEKLAASSIEDPAKAQREGMPASETAAFLRWIANDHFVFLGARAYKYVNGVAVPEKGGDLGWLKADPSVDLQEEVPLSLIGDQSLYFAKSATVGRIHRPAYPDILRVIEVDSQGQRTGEIRFVGLYTAAVYRTSVRNIPIVRTLAANIANESHFLMSGYDGKFLWQLMETYPRDEWLQSSFDHLNDVFMQVISLQERPLLRVLTRVDAAYRFVSVIVFVPKDRYTTALRRQFEEILKKHLPVMGMNFDVYFSESVLARVNMTIRVNASQRFSVDPELLQAEFSRASLSWEERLVIQMRQMMPKEMHSFLETEFVNHFPEVYKAETSAEEAARDINGLNSISPNKQVHLELQKHDDDAANMLRLKLYGRGNLPAYSKMIPILEHMGFQVENARTHSLMSASGTPYSITHYLVKTEVDVKSVDTIVLQPHLEDAIDRVLSGNGSSDQFNRLLLICGLNVNQVRLLRAYARYMRQIGFNLSYRYMANTLARYPAITKKIVDLFEAKFNLGETSVYQRLKDVAIESHAIGLALEDVTGVDDDRILRQYLVLVLATKRTNYYIQPKDPKENPYLAFKMKPAEIPGMPRPVPHFEIFVYSSKMEGVHLRGGPVARGGLRWSDRLEDYRTEVLGLVKAQQVKNAVIVPVGAKGCFVCKRLPQNVSRQETMEAVQHCYKTFIRGLLSVTDNLVKGEVVPPQNVIRFDSDDPYLVVAADKGTATFSDLANEVAHEHDFWMGDAFASGGSRGYDHKKMGITAKGGWVSVQRHFRELNIDIQAEPFTAIGIGDMAGDVFGNGMLLSKHTRLCAAFNHRHIFIDPNPNESKSFEERRRLFNLPQSSWEDYKSDLISAGGGIFSRDLKSINITPQMAERFGITASKLTPTELINALLKAPVDLIWNGGIGTYVKSSSEENLRVGDKANDLTRVNGNQLRCRVFGEGGNLGCTQLGRIEAAKTGVKLNTDFIDNAGGVDCSDHEVNIKILLAALMQEGRLDEDSRNTLLESMTDEVSGLVLSNNANQVRALGLAEHESAKRLEEYRRLIHRLEAGSLDRALEFLPDEEELQERGLAGHGLTRPELAVLLCYSKAELKEALAQSSLTESQYALNEAYTAFPESLVNKYEADIRSHRLIKQIAATQMSNSLIHRVGVTAVQRMIDGGANIEQTLASYLAVKNILKTDELWAEIDNSKQLTHELQVKMFFAVQGLLRRSMRLILRQSHGNIDIEGNIKRYEAGVNFFFSNIGSLLQDEEKESWQSIVDEYVAGGVEESLAKRVAACNFGLAAFDIIDAHYAIENGELSDTSELYFVVRSILGCQWLESQIRDFPVMNQWTAKAREALLDELYSQQSQLVALIVDAGKKEIANGFDKSDPGTSLVMSLVQAFTLRLDLWIQSWHKSLAEMRSLNTIDHPVATVALRELAELVNAARKWSQKLNA